MTGWPMVRKFGILGLCDSNLKSEIPNPQILTIGATVFPHHSSSNLFGADATARGSE